MHRYIVYCTKCTCSSHLCKFFKIKHGTKSISGIRFCHKVSASSHRAKSIGHKDTDAKNQEQNNGHKASRPDILFSRYPLFPIFSVPDILCSRYSLFPFFYVPNILCSRYSLFPIFSVPDILCSRYSLFPIFSVPDILCSRYFCYRYSLLPIKIVPK